MTGSFFSQPFTGLDLLSTAVLIVDWELTLRYANPAAESLFAFSMKSVAHLKLERILPGNPALFSMLEQAKKSHMGYSENELTLEMPNHATLRLACVVSPVDQDDSALVLEFRQLDQQLKIAREERILERQLPDAELREYTQVIVKEADRLQILMDRMLTPHRLPQISSVNIHEVLERVRSLILAEFPDGIRIRRDYDTSLPDLSGDREQLIQAILNVARNAAQAMNGKGEIHLVTRIARSITLSKQRYRHAVQVEIIDNGPGVPQHLREKIFYPLISGRDDGTGLGLSLAQHFICLLYTSADA